MQKLSIVTLFALLAGCAGLDKTDTDNDQVTDVDDDKDQQVDDHDVANTSSHLCDLECCDEPGGGTPPPTITCTYSPPFGNRPWCASGLISAMCLYCAAGPSCAWTCTGSTGYNVDADGNPVMGGNVPRCKMCVTHSTPEVYTCKVPTTNCTSNAL